MDVVGGTPKVSQYGSVDPAPPSLEVDIEKLKLQLLDENNQMFLRMRTVFSLRNNGSDEACWPYVPPLSQKVHYYSMN